MLLFRLTFSIYSFCFISVWCRLLFALFLTLLTTSFVGYSSCVCLQSCVRVLMPFVLEIIFIFPQFLDAVFFQLFICRLWVWFCVCVCAFAVMPHITLNRLHRYHHYTQFWRTQCVCVCTIVVVAGFFLPFRAYFREIVLAWSSQMLIRPPNERNMQKTTMSPFLLICLASCCCCWCCSSTRDKWCKWYH